MSEEYAWLGTLLLVFIGTIFFCALFLILTLNASSNEIKEFRENYEREYLRDLKEKEKSYVS